MRAGIALGSNLGDRRANLAFARKAISQLTLVSEPILVSAIYETEPVGCAPGTPPFLNAVMEIEYGGNADDLLTALKRLERERGRPDHRERNVSRVLDLDLLYLGEEKMNLDAMTLPHPRMMSRRFVLEPLAEIRSGPLPGQSRSATDLLQTLPSGENVRKFAEQW